MSAKTLADLFDDAENALFAAQQEVDTAEHKLRLLRDQVDAPRPLQRSQLDALLERVEHEACVARRRLGDPSRVAVLEEVAGWLQDALRDVRTPVMAGR